MLTYVAVFHSFSLMYSIPFLVHTIFYLSIFLVINIFVSSFFFPNYRVPTNILAHGLSYKYIPFSKKCN